MRRLRACLASTHSGGAGAPPGGHYGLPARSWLTAVVHKSDDPPQSVPGRRKEERRDGAPRGARVLERERGTTEQWLRHLARHPPRIWRGKRETGLPGASTKNTGDDACLGMIPKQTAPDCIDKAGRIAC